MKTLVLRISGGAGVCAVSLLALASLAGCFDNDPGMQEKLIRSQVQLEETKQKLQEATAALEKAQAALKSQAAATPAPMPTPVAPTKEQLNDGYIAAAKEMRDQLKTELSGYTILNTRLFEVNTVAVLPYTSKVSIALRSDKGQQYKLELPVGADAAGKWKFPTTQEILDGIGKISPKAVAANNPQTGPASGNPMGGQRPGPFEPRGQDRPAGPPPVGGIGDSNVETVPLTWSPSQTRSSNSDRSQGAAPVQPPLPPSVPPGRTASQGTTVPPPRQIIPPPGQPAQPAPAMPADQSVLVTF